MSAPSHGWRTAKPDGNALTLDDSRVFARRHKDDRLWLNVQLRKGQWTYIVLDGNGNVVAQEFAATRRECWERTRDALKRLDAGSMTGPTG
jgi:hypothetical protein